MSELSHERAARLIYQGHLSDAERQVLRSHLRTCAACRRQTTVDGLLFQYLPLQKTSRRPSPQFTADYLARAARRSRRSQIMKPVYAVGGAVALALVVLAGWCIVRGNPETTALEAVPVQTIISAVPETQETPEMETGEGASGEQIIDAVAAGDVAAVERLLEAGASADAEDSYGNAALALAARDGQLEIVKLLLDAGADVNGTVAAGSTREGGNFGSTRGAMQAGANESALSEAVINDHIEIVKLLIAYGVDLNYAEDNVGTTALHRAAMLIDPEIIKILLESGADPNPSSDLGFGETPLHYAGYRASRTAAQALLEGGADVNAQAETGMTPMMTALGKGLADDGSFITLLLENGADVNIKDSGIGNTALHYAARQGRSNDIPILIAHGAQINQQNGGGNTPLHQAAKWNRTRSVQILIDEGADANILNSRDQTALDIAANERIAEILREAGGE